MKPKITVIIPVYNTGKYLEECLNSICKQSLQEIELICINDGSTDNSLSILKQLAKTDERIVVLDGINEGVASARNKGILKAKGDYIAFMDSDDKYPSENVLEKMYEGTKKSGLMICGGSLNMLVNGKIVDDPSSFEPGYTFQYDGILSYDEYQYDYGFTRFLYNRNFLLNNKIFFPKLIHQEDPVFFIKAMSLAGKFYALKIPTYIYRKSHKSTSWTEKRASDLFQGLQECLVLSKKYGLFELHKRLCNRLKEKGFRMALCNNLNSCGVIQNYVSAINEIEASVTDLDFCGQSDITKEVIVSMSSSPARIQNAALAIRRIYEQTKLPDKVILWLAVSDFPGKLKDLPGDILKLVSEKGLSVRWCEDDLKSHNKYFWVLKDNPDALIITVDDDILYHNRLIENLYLSYLLYPRAVSAARVCLLPVSQMGEIPPYDSWPIVNDAYVSRVSMQFFAIGRGGVLYPASLFTQAWNLFDQNTIQRTCLYEDDLWLKAMELVAEIPVAVSEEYKEFHYTSDSQETALCRENWDNGMNNKLFLLIQKEIDRRYGNNTFLQKLMCSSSGENLTGLKVLSNLASYYQEKDNRIKKQLDETVKRYKHDLKEANHKLAEATRLNRELERVKKGWSFKIGRIITFIPRKMRAWLKN